ncbi:MAG TPA: hypothetical protein VF223_07785, partial [Trebonia sp.]
ARRPVGWVDTVILGALPGGTPLGQVRAEPIGHSFTAGTDSLRAALDAAVLSPAGLAVAVDGDGAALGVATFDQLRSAIQREAIQAADNGHGRQTRRVQHAHEGPLP